ncbi:MAG: type II secretion system protein GspG [Planctomycetota bacterium]|jgi:general secretion pathway protein G
MNIFGKDKSSRILQGIAIAGLAGIVLVIVLPGKPRDNSEAFYRAAVNRIEFDFAELHAAIAVYKLHMGKYPDRLANLVIEPDDIQSWKGPYLIIAAKDPWGNPYDYGIVSGNENFKYVLISYGEDGRPGGEDNEKDIIELGPIKN